MARPRLLRRRSTPPARLDRRAPYLTARARLRRFGAGVPGARSEAAAACFTGVVGALLLGGVVSLATGTWLWASVAAIPAAITAAWALSEVDHGARRARRVGRRAAVAWFRAERLDALGPSTDADVEVRVAGTSMQCPTARVIHRSECAALRRRDNTQLPELLRMAEELTERAHETVVDAVRSGTLEPAGRRVDGRLVLIAADPVDDGNRHLLSRLNDIASGLWTLDQAVGRLERGDDAEQSVALAGRLRDLDLQVDAHAAARHELAACDPNRWS